MAAYLAWPLPNVYLGVSAERQQEADERIAELLMTPAAGRFLSAEPLLGPLQVSRFLGKVWIERKPVDAAGLPIPTSRRDATYYRGLDGVICGGESGPGARACWAPNIRAIVKQCAAAGVACFVKQLGSNVQDRNDAGFDGENNLGGLLSTEWPDGTADRIEHDLDGTRDGYQGAPVRIHLRDRKGGDPAEWPEDLRVRQLPWRRHEQRK